MNNVLHDIYCVISPNSIIDSANETNSLAGKYVDVNVEKMSNWIGSFL